MFFAHKRARRWRAHHGPHHHPGSHGGGGRGFGVRRPLRFLIDRLELDDDQAAVLAKVLQDLRLEREQAELDRRKASATLADLVAADPLDKTGVEEAAEARVAAARKERDAVIAAVERLHGALSPDQRGKLSTLLRSGPLSL